MAHRVLSLFIVLGLSSASAKESSKGVPSAPPSPQLQVKDAQNSFAFGDYPRVISLLTPLVEPDILLAKELNLTTAYRLLGIAHFFLGNTERSGVFFERLIRLRPDSELDPVRTPPPAVAFFARIKARLAAEISRKREALRRQKAKEAEQRRLANTLLIQKEYRENSRLIASIPFGVGQFQNGDPWLGGIFLGSQLSAISVSVASFIAVENLRGSSGRFRISDAGRARDFQKIQIISGATAIGLAVIGVVEAMISFKPRRFLRENRKTGFSPKSHLSPGGLLLRF